MAVKQFHILENKSDKDKDKFVKRVHRELQYGFYQCHPNLIKVIGISDNPSNENNRWKLPLSIMEFGGENLKDCLKKIPMTFSQKKNILLGIASGVQHLHSQNLVHRDLKVV